ncbi:S8 family serine peptidase [Paraliobacillus sp. JSM ZJ581]|uniref:S8 family serine peptidase n=1 Tax=Paraliobacillus sp. JSM ZJ581 TaxID=3342118 RepID=UPI0035A90686
MGVNSKTENKNIKVAILDSGINKNHEDLEGKIVKEFSTVDGRNNNDVFNHGTAIAGIITANDNDKGIIGLNQSVDIYDVKVLDENGKGSIEQLTKGIQWSISQGVDIINLSFGFQSDSKELKKIINEATDSGIIVVAAAGNTYGLGMDYPAQYENVISVNAIDSDLNLIDASALGDTDFVAPGKDILSTNSQGRYSLYSGTSFSTAYVTGALSSWLVKYKTTINSKKKVEKIQLLNFIKDRYGIEYKKQINILKIK